MTIKKHYDKDLIGAYGEMLALKWLREKGFSIILRNYRRKRFEGDIIAYKNGVLHIVEVKTRTYNKDYPIEYSVNKHKLKSMRFVAMEVLAEKDIHLDFDEVSLDVFRVEMEFLEGVV